MTSKTASALRVLEPQPGHAAAAAGAGAPVLGWCEAAEHPTLPGRTRVRWNAAGGDTQTAWLAQLNGVCAREGDRVLLIFPENHDEPVVVGVLDGLAGPAPLHAAGHGPVLQLAADESLRIAGPDGATILEVKPTAAGPEVRLFTNPAALTLPGSFRVSAADIEFEARQGEVRIAASGDVKVTGEIVRLN